MRQTDSVPDPVPSTNATPGGPASSENAPPPWLRTAAGWSWRLIVLAAGVALVFWAVTQVLIVFVAVFLALVITAVLNPLTDLYHRVMPRALATAAAILSGVLVIGGLLTYVVVSVAGQWERLAGEFNTGIDQIVDLIENNSLPVTVEVDTRDQWIDDVADWIQENSQTLVSRAAESAGSIVEGVAVLVLAIFCTVFFLASGAAMWRWFMTQVPARTRQRWHDVAGAGWYTFSGYTRGIVLVAISNGILAGIFLSILGVPLAAPLAVLVFIGTFIPLIGGGGARGGRAPDGARRHARHRGYRPARGARAAAAHHGQAGVAAPGGGGSRRHVRHGGGRHPRSDRRRPTHRGGLVRVQHPAQAAGRRRACA
jgi:predicted PurR-regulated permease PerM